jgi:CHAD domain-containing protein
MRSAFRVFVPYYEAERVKPFTRGLRDTARALGRVRDLDVFMERAEGYLAEVPAGEQSALEPLLNSWLDQREVARGRMLTYLDSKRYQRFVGDFHQFLTTEGDGVKPTPAGKPIPTLVYQIAPSLIYQRYEVVRGYERLIADAPLEILHALRIDCKRFRYTLEFFREVLGTEVDDVIKQTVKVQDHLGDLNDADVACQILIGFLNNWSKLKRRERINISGVTRYLVTKQSELRDLVDTFPEAWRQYNRPEFRRKLALAVASL